MTKKQKGILYMASRPCGLSYRAACNRGIDIATKLKDDGYLIVTDNGRSLGQYVFRATDKAKEALK